MRNCAVERATSLTCLKSPCERLRAPTGLASTLFYTVSSCTRMCTHQRDVFFFWKIRNPRVLIMLCEAVWQRVFFFECVRRSPKASHSRLRRSRISHFMFFEALERSPVHELVILEVFERMLASDTVWKELQKLLSSLLTIYCERLSHYVPRCIQPVQVRKDTADSQSLAHQSAHFIPCTDRTSANHFPGAFNLRNSRHTSIVFSTSL